MSRPALLDVNLLVALFDPDHVHHDLAHDWMAENRARGWATCPITENGLVRVLASPSYGSPINRPGEIIARLRVFCASGDHVFWPDLISFRDHVVFAPAFLGGHRQLIDVYLLGLAHANGGRLATFDRTIPIKAVVGHRRDLLEVITAEAAE